MKPGELGKEYHDGEIIIKQGDTENCMYVIQSGEVEVLGDNNGSQVRLAVRKTGEFFGEMALTHNAPRAALPRPSN